MCTENLTPPSEGELSNHISAAWTTTTRGRSALFILCAWRCLSAEAATLAVLATRGPIWNGYVQLELAPGQPSWCTACTRRLQMALLAALAQVRHITLRIPEHCFPEPHSGPPNLPSPECAGCRVKLAHAGQSQRRLGAFHARAAWTEFVDEAPSEHVRTFHSTHSTIAERSAPAPHPVHMSRQV